MVSASVSMSASFVVSEAAQNQKVIFYRLQRIEDIRKRKISSNFRRGPVCHVHAIRDVNECHSLRCRDSRCIGHETHRWNHRLQKREGHGSSQSTQKRPSWNMPIASHANWTKVTENSLKNNSSCVDYFGPTNFQAACGGSTDRDMVLSRVVPSINQTNKSPFVFCRRRSMCPSALKSLTPRIFRLDANG